MARRPEPFPPSTGAYRRSQRSRAIRKVASRRSAGVACGWAYMYRQTPRSTRPTPAISQVAQKSLRTRRRSDCGSGILARRGRGIAAASQSVQLLLGRAGAGRDPAVPGVVRLEGPAEPRANQCRDPRHERRGDDALEKLLRPLLGDLAIEIEAPV